MTSQLPGVYMILHVASDTRYVGSSISTIAQRFGTHRYTLRNNKHRNPHLQAAWNKYGEDAFAFLVLENTPTADVLTAEARWYQQFKRAGLRLYNMKPGGQNSQLGLRHSDKTKQQMAKSHLGLKYKMTPEGSAKISEMNRRKLTPEVRAKIAHTWTGLIAPNGETHTIHNLLSFCRENALDMSAMRKVALGYVKSYKGWTSPNARSAYLVDHPLTTYPASHFTCPQCGKDFTDKTSAKRKFCSKTCRNEHDRATYSGKGNPNFRHGKRIIQK